MMTQFSIVGHQAYVAISDCSDASCDTNGFFKPLNDLGHFFQNVILFSDDVHNKCMKLAQYNEYLISTVDTDGLVL